MNGLLPFLLFVGLVELAYGQCPPPEVIAPCLCDSDLSISCKNIAGRNFNFRERFEFVRQDVVFQKLHISNMNITEIKEGDFEHLKVREIHVRVNENLIRISPNAFRASWNVTTILNLSSNRLANYFPRQRDIFELVKSFPNLVSVDLARNRITSIPADALQNLPFLGNISLRGNQISDIGSRAFATGSHNLTYINLDKNLLRGYGPPEDAFEGISTSARVDLRLNFELGFMGQKSYQGLVDRAARIDVGAEICSFSYCLPVQSYFVCDRRSDWICENKEAYYPKLGSQGILPYFTCVGGTDIWDYCAKRNPSQSVANNS